MPNTYREQLDLPDHNNPSPIDPWGLLTQDEKVQAAVVHARLVRTYPPVNRVSPPEPVWQEDINAIQEGILRCTRAGAAHCTFGLGHGTRPWLLPYYIRGVSREISDMRQNINGPVCMSCAEVIERDRMGYQLQPYTPDQCPNARTTTAYRFWDSGYSGICITHCITQAEGAFTLRVTRNGLPGPRIIGTYSHRTLHSAARAANDLALMLQPVIWATTPIAAIRSSRRMEIHEILASHP